MSEETAAPTTTETNEAVPAPVAAPTFSFGDPSAAPAAFKFEAAPVFGAAAAAPKADDEDDAAAEANLSAEPNVHFEPLVQLPEVEVKTNEEDEDVEYKQKAKLFRFDKEANMWKERGSGEVKILKHKETGRFRLLMRREKTLKICANHHIIPGLELTPNAGSDRSWVWSVNDFADEELKSEVLAIRFANAEIAGGFKTEFDKAREAMKAFEKAAEAAPAASEEAPKPE